jgi:hypothetical protein
METYLDFFRAELESLPLLDRGLNEDLISQARGHIAAGRIPFDQSVMLL